MSNANDFPVLDKDSEFNAGVYGEEFSEDKVIGNLFWGLREGLVDCGGGSGEGGKFRNGVGVGVINTVIKGMFEVMGDKVGGFEEEIDVACCAAFEGICGGNPGCILL